MYFWQELAYLRFRILILMITIFGLFILGIFGLGLLHSLKLVFFGSLFYFYPNVLLRFFISFRNSYFPFSLSLLFMEFIYTHFRLFIVASLIPIPPYIFILYITMYSYVLFLLLCEYIYFVQLNFFFHFITFLFLHGLIVILYIVNTALVGS